MVQLLQPTGYKRSNNAFKEFEPLKIDLQLFADDEGAEDDPNKSQETNQMDDPNTEPGTLQTTTFPKLRKSWMP